MNLTEQRAATRNLPRPVVALVPAHQDPHARQICGFIPVAHYGLLKPLPTEIGSVEYVRYVVADVDALRYLSGEEAERFIADHEAI